MLVMVPRGLRMSPVFEIEERWDTDFFFLHLKVGNAERVMGSRNPSFP